MPDIKTDFDLEKWYLDCVTESGEAFIGYVAVLRWKKFQVPYSSTILLSPDSEVQVSTRLSKPVLPVVDSQDISWEDVRLKVSGHWQNNASGLEAILHKNDQGYLSWHCFQPSSIVRIKLKSNFYKGFGYAEKLRLTDLPWNIDMHTLRWGRFCSKEHNLVWIQISGESTRHWLWYNNDYIAQPTINDDSIILSSHGIELTLDQSALIESEQKIFNTVKKLVKYLPGFDKVIPLKFLYSDEKKWRSFAQLWSGGVALAKGWAIHERVDFS